MKTVARTRGSVITSLLVVGGLLTVYYLQRRNGRGTHRLIDRAKELVNRGSKEMRNLRDSASQAYNMDNVDLDRNPAI